MAAFSSIVMAVGAAFSLKGQLDQRKAMKSQEKAAKRQAAAMREQYAAEERRAEVQNVRTIRGEIRKRRAAAASIIASGATHGTSRSSGVLGGVASLGSQMAGNLSYMSDIAQHTGEIDTAQRNLGQANYAFGQASGDLATAQGLSSLGGTIFGMGTQFNETAVAKNVAGSSPSGSAFNRLQYSNLGSGD
jgi:hypothetical protein